MWTLYTEYIENSYKSTTTKKTTQCKQKNTRDLNRYFTNEDIQMAKKHMNRKFIIW